MAALMEKIAVKTLLSQKPSSRICGVIGAHQSNDKIQWVVVQRALDAKNNQLREVNSC
jgi:hypothetical protein